MRIPKSFWYLSAACLILGLVHFYGRELQQELKAHRKSRLSLLRMNASLGPVQLPQARELKPIEQIDELLGQTALQVAENYFLLHKEEWDIREYHTHAATEFKNPLGTTVKFSFSQDGIPIVGMDLLIKVGRDLNVQEVENNYRALDKAEVGPEQFLSRDEIANVMPDRFRNPAAIYNESKPILYVTPTGYQPILSYVVKTKDRGRKDRFVEVVLRAEDGQILNMTTPRSEF